jgi:hypothetical protein
VHFYTVEFYFSLKNSTVMNSISRHFSLCSFAFLNVTHRSTWRLCCFGQNCAWSWSESYYNDTRFDTYYIDVRHILRPFFKVLSLSVCYHQLPSIVPKNQFRSKALWNIS